MVTISLFSGETIDKYLQQKKELFKQRVTRQINGDNSDLDREKLEAIIPNYKAENIKLNLNAIETNKLDQSGNVIPGDQLAHAIRFYIPFAGDHTILGYSPRSRSVHGYITKLDDAKSELVVDIPTGDGDGVKVLQQFEDYLKILEAGLKDFTGPFIDHNHALGGILQDIVLKHVSYQTKQKELLTHLKFPERTIPSAKKNSNPSI